MNNSLNFMFNGLRLLCKKLMWLSKNHKRLSKTHRNDVLDCTTQMSWIVQLKGSELYNSQ